MGPVDQGSPFGDQVLAVVQQGSQVSGRADSEPDRRQLRFTSGDPGDRQRINRVGFALAELAATLPGGHQRGHLDHGNRPRRLPAQEVGLWVGIQLAIAGLLIVGGAAAVGDALNAAAAWWMVYAVIVDLGTLGAIAWLIRCEGVTYRSLLGPPAAVWQIALGALGVLAATLPAVAYGTEVTKAFYGDATLPMFAMVDVPVWASVFAVLLGPLLAELAEPVAYLGILLPWLERRIRRSWLAATVVVAIWAAEHAFYPLLTDDGGLDLAFAAYRVVSVLPFLAVWTAIYYAFGRRLLPIMVARLVFNGGTAIAVALNLIQ
jgi:Type II CAAX prenyl endopeptidase Rce1-like